MDESEECLDPLPFLRRARLQQSKAMYFVEYALVALAPPIGSPCTAGGVGISRKIAPQEYRWVAPHKVSAGDAENLAINTINKIGRSGEAAPGSGFRTFNGLNA